MEILWHVIGISALAYLIFSTLHRLSKIEQKLKELSND